MRLKLPLLVLLVFFAFSVQAQTRYTADAGHSNVGFSVPILDGVSKVSGKFSDFTVTLDYNEADVTKSTVSAAIKATSVDTGIERRDAHLRNADFFDVEKFPEITFQSTKVEKQGKNFVAIGTFTMHGVAKEIRIPFTSAGKFVNPANNATSIGFSASLALNRRDFGINYKNASLPTFIGDLIQIDLNLLFRPPPPPK
jgi:polyisoprenoid-binding protein YceI